MKLLFALVAAACALGVQAETLTWSGTVTLPSGTITDDIELDGEVTVVVDSGRVILDGVIRDAAGKVGKIVKTGKSELKIRNNFSASKPETLTPNTFSGGIVVRGGSVSAGGSSGIAKDETHCPAGTGEIVVDRSQETGSADTGINFMGCLGNAISVIGETSFQYPFLNRGGGSGFNGAISVPDSDVYIIAYTTRPDATELTGRMSVNSAFSAGTSDEPKDIYYYGGTWLGLSGKVTCRTLDCYQEPGQTHTHYAGMFGGFYLKGNFPQSEVDLVRLDEGALDCEVNGAGNGFGLELYGGHPSRTELTKRYSDSSPSGKVINTSYVILNNTKDGWTQTFRWVKSDPREDDEPNYDFRATKQTTLQISGEADVTAVCSMAVGENIELVIGGEAPESFVQVFSNRQHQINRPVTVGGGTLRFAGTAAVPELQQLTLGAKGRIDMAGEQSELVVSSMSIGGEYLISGTYTSEDYPDNIAEGTTVWVRNGRVPDPAGTAVWKGGAADTALATAGNWVGETAPKVDGFDGDRLVFAASGDTATAANGQKINSMVFTNIDNGAATFTLQGSGASADDTRVEVVGQVDMADASMRTTLRNLTLGTPKGQSQGPAEDGGDKNLLIVATNFATGAQSLVLDNVTIEKPVCVQTHPSKTTYFLATAANSVNEFRGELHKTSGNWFRFDVGSGSRLTFSGGVRCNWKAQIDGKGTVVFTNQPWTASGVENGIINVGCTNVILAVADNYMGYTHTGNQDGIYFSPADYSAVKVDFLVDDVVPRSRMAFLVKGDRTYTVDLHGTHQKTAGLWLGSDNVLSKKSSGTFTGSAGSALEVANKSPNVSSNCFAFAGAVSLRKSGTGTLVLHRSGKCINEDADNACTSTGDVSVSDGVFEIDERVTWLNGTNVTVSGTGTLKLNQGGVFGRKAVLRFADTGVLEMPEGAKQRVFACYVGETKLEDGLYEAGKLPAGCPLEGHLTGGILDIRGPQGGVLIVR